MAAIRALLYGCLLVSCAGFLAMQCHQLVTLYISEPTAFIRRMEPADTRAVPGLTVCPSTRLQADVLANWSVLNENDRWPEWQRFPENATLDQLWMEAAVDLNQLVFSCLEGECNAQGPRGGPAVYRGTGRCSTTSAVSATPSA